MWKYCCKTVILCCLVLTLVIDICQGQVDECVGKGPRGPGCDQAIFTQWDVEVSGKLEDDGRLPGVTSHDKAEKYLLNTTEWCESIRPCPLQFGTTSASHNSDKAGEVTKKQSSWSSGTVTRSALTSGDVWIQYSLTNSRPLALGFLMFKPIEDVTQFRFEGSSDEKSWETIELRAESKSQDLWSYKIVISPSMGARSYLYFRLRIVETKWSAAGTESGSVSIGNLQLCFIDRLDDTSDNPFVASPPWLMDPKADAFASSRWGRNWHERNAFTLPSLAWCSKCVYATRGVLNEPQYIGYTFPAPRVVRKIRLMGSYQAKWRLHHPKVFDIQGCNEIDVESCNDKDSWTTLSSVALPTFRSISRTEELEIPEENLRPYLHYRFYVIKTGWSVQGAPWGYIILRGVRLC